MDKQPVGQLPDLTQSNNDDEIMVITNSEYNQLKKEKISDLITDFTSTNENNALTKGTDGKMFVTDFGNASNITEGTLPTSVLPEIPLEKLPVSGVTADTYAYPSSVTVNAQGQVTAISEGSPSGANANTDLSNITEAGKEVIRETAGTGYQLFDIIAKDHVLSFEESKGFGLQGTYVYKEAVTGSRYGYPDFYAKCVEEKTAGTETQTQLGDSTITTYNNSNGHIFYDIADKSTVDTYFASTGEAWFYGIDTTNERIFLPRTTRFQYTNDTSKVGEYQEAGLPNVTGSIHGNRLGYQNEANSEGCFTCEISISEGAYNASGSKGTQFNFDASLSNSIYGNSDTVTPSATNQLLYIVVGNTEVESAATDITDVTTTENDTIPLFTGMYFDFTPNHVSWLKAGQQANSGGLYTSAYNTLVTELTNPTYGLKIIDVDNMQSDVDYSEYWKVDQTNQTFTTPARLSNAALTGRVKGNGKSFVYTNGTTEYGVGLYNASNNFLTLKGGVVGENVGTSGTNVNSAAGYNSLGITTDPANSGIVAEEATSQLYFKVANAVQNLQLLDAGEITEALADKIGRTECKAYITETYTNGNSGYTVYSNGLCEQWGVKPYISGQEIVKLLKNYINTDYNVQTTYNAGELTNGAMGVYNMTTTSFDVKLWSTQAVFWRACGYIS